MSTLAQVDPRAYQLYVEAFEQTIASANTKVTEKVLLVELLRQLDQVEVGRRCECLESRCCTYEFPSKQTVGEIASISLQHSGIVCMAFYNLYSLRLMKVEWV